MHNFIETLYVSAGAIDESKASCAKPVKTFEHIIKIASNKGDLVFDPFMGVASTVLQR